MEQKNREILIRGLTDILIEVFQIDIEEGKNNVYKELSELEDDLLWEKKKILESYVESMQELQSQHIAKIQQAGNSLLEEEERNNTNIHLNIF